MSDTYVKLFGSITASTIWQEPAATRLVWITLLAMSDKSGCVYASVPGLAHIANVSLQDTEAALTTLLSPDNYSRTKVSEGRRIEPIDGGWQLINHAKFRAMRSAEERREYMREYMRDKRARESEPLADSLAELAESTDVTPPALAPTPIDQKKRTASPAEEPAADPIWGTGLDFLKRKGLREPPARAFLGLLRKELHDDLTVAELLGEAERQDVSNPQAWLSAAAKQRKRQAQPRAGPVGPTSKIGGALVMLERKKSGNRGLDLSADATLALSGSGGDASRRVIGRD